LLKSRQLARQFDLKPNGLFSILAGTNAWRGKPIPPGQRHGHLDAHVRRAVPLTQLRRHGAWEPFRETDFLDTRSERRPEHGASITRAGHFTIDTTIADWTGDVAFLQAIQRGDVASISMHLHTWLAAMIDTLSQLFSQTHEAEGSSSRMAPQYRSARVNMPCW
jgi:hypothetical protein